MYQFILGQCRSHLPEFEVGEATVRVYEIASGLLVTGIHGSEDGFMSFIVEVDEGDFHYHVPVTSEELVGLVQEWTGLTDLPAVTVCPCYPIAVRRRYGDQLTIAGNWEGETLWFWDEQSHIIEPAE